MSSKHVDNFVKTAQCSSSHVIVNDADIIRLFNIMIFILQLHMFSFIIECFLSTSQTVKSIRIFKELHSAACWEIGR